MEESFMKNKKTKKVLAFILAAVMSLAMCVTAFASETPQNDERSVTIEFMEVSLTGESVIQTVTYTADDIGQAFPVLEPDNDYEMFKGWWFVPILEGDYEYPPNLPSDGSLVLTEEIFNAL